SNGSGLDGDQGPEPYPDAAYDRSYPHSLASHVGNGRVHYDGIAGDRHFATFIEVLKQTDPQVLADSADALAFWINAYNALVMRGVIDFDVPENLEAVGLGLFVSSIEYEVAGLTISLDALENGIVRDDESHPSVSILPQQLEDRLMLLHPQLFNDRTVDPRVHFAITCAAMSCPKLLSIPYQEATLDSALDANTRAYLASPKGLVPHTDAPTEYSDLFQWFEADFARAYSSVFNFVRNHVPIESFARMSPPTGASYLAYDWTVSAIR
ncbi:MAG: DUF547 domain-containing protein, partial [Candidatus Latescibacteria bacterium]|nr:DUF547 domain-containing protein [Candidatus Latescibacterota bacterium]